MNKINWTKNKELIDYILTEVKLSFENIRKEKIWQKFKRKNFDNS